MKKTIKECLPKKSWKRRNKMKLLILSIFALSFVGCATYSPVFQAGEQPKSGWINTTPGLGVHGLAYCTLENEKPVCYKPKIKD
jgi:hypothetical protein